MAVSLCAATVANTGAIQCDIAPGIPVAIFIWNDIQPITAVQGSQFQPFLENAAQLSKSAAGKLFLFPIIQDVADKTQSNKTGTLNLGFSTILLEGKPDYEFKVFAGQSLVPQLRKFNNQNVKILILDNHNRVWGVASGSNFTGAQVKMFTTGIGFATGQAVDEGVVTISVSYLIAAELNDAAAYGQITSFSNILGLIDANVGFISNIANVYKIGITIPTAQIGQTINLGNNYSTLLANAALWVAYTGNNFATTLAITSVAYDATIGAWTVTFDSTAFGALAVGTKIQLGLVAPPTLNAANITGIEGVVTILTK